MKEPPLHVLLAESSRVAQAAIQFQLQQLGQFVSVANHGPEMQSLSDQSPFDTYFIDVRMINELEAEFLERIFARSAVIGIRSELDPVEAGDRFRTKLVKPFSRRELASALAEVPRRANKLPSIIRKEELLARVGGNRELLRQMADLFQTQANLWQKQMRKALEQRNSDELGRIAHQAKGSL